MGRLSPRVAILLWGGALLMVGRTHEGGFIIYIVSTWSVECEKWNWRLKYWVLYISEPPLVFLLASVSLCQKFQSKSNYFILELFNWLLPWTTWHHSEKTNENIARVKYLRLTIPDIFATQPVVTKKAWSWANRSSYKDLIPRHTPYSEFAYAYSGDGPYSHREKAKPII